MQPAWKRRWEESDVSGGGEMGAKGWGRDKVFPVLVAREY